MRMRMKMQKCAALALMLTATSVVSFAPTTSTRVLPATSSTLILHTTAKEQQFTHLEEMAHKFRLRVFDVDTGVYGFESKDPQYGIQNIRTRVIINPDDQSLGLELTEFAHSETDHRGLVLVTKVTNVLTPDLPIHVGDTIIGVFAGTDFKESTTAVDYDETVDVLHRATAHARSLGRNSIELELNRIVQRAHVTVEVEDDNGKVTTLEPALAGDNLRLLLLHKHVPLYDGSLHRLDQPHLTNDCGGEGICGTCMVQVLQGMDHLNAKGPQEQSLLHDRPSSWRAACKTVIGADNAPNTILRVRLHPHQYLEPLEDPKLRP